MGRPHHKKSLTQRIIHTIRHFAVPHVGNDYRAKALHIDVLTVYLLIALALTLLVPYVATSSSNILGYATDITVDSLLTLTNQKRQEQGMSHLTYNQQLANAAYAKAQDMFAKGYWAHYGPNGETPWGFIVGQQYQYEYAGENLAKNFMFSNGVVDAWMNSPTHRDNILSGNYTEVGFAVVDGVLNGEETTLVVQMFGKPYATALARQPEVILGETPVVTPRGEPAQAIIQSTLTRQSDTTPSAESLSPAVSPRMVAQAQDGGSGDGSSHGGMVVCQSKQSKPLINLMPALFNAKVLFLVTMILILIVDLYIATKMRIVRINSKNIVHVIFLLFILIGAITAIARGSIL